MTGLIPVLLVAFNLVKVGVPPFDLVNAIAVGLVTLEHSTLFHTIPNLVGHSTSEIHDQTPNNPCLPMASSKP
ncbi:MAG: hypothetical protein IPJ06_10500 [Saprospiraceae bacterium]|nr:hypothetical protein [Saprospiraceae bacterium]